jgi:hypothetical protein
MDIPVLNAILLLFFNETFNDTGFQLITKKNLFALNVNIQLLTLMFSVYISKKNIIKLLSNVFIANIIHIGEQTFTNMSKECIEK